MIKNETRKLTTMNRIKVPLAQIQSIDRQRIELGNIDELAGSIQRYGLIQPIVINQDYRLIAGGRRLAAHEKLGLKEIDCVFRETLNADELHELELEENIRRLDMSWQEQCLNIAKIHQLKSKRSAMESRAWGQKETGAMLGIAVGHINYNLQIAGRLELELGVDNKPIANARFWPLESLAEAWRLILRDRQDALEASLAEDQRAMSAQGIQEPEAVHLVEEVTKVESNPDLLALERERYYSNPHNPPNSFEEYWAEKQARVSEIQNTIYITNRLHHADAIEYMHKNKGVFDHVITDIPYGIDMEMLSQQDHQRGMVDIDTVAELHDVEYNKQLIADFFPAAFNATKDAAYVITWADQMLWQYMYDCAIKAGFAVQRWPITWAKTHSCMNQCAQFNTTKDTEIAIVCRKKGTTLVNQPQTSIITAGRDDLCKDLDHPFAKPFAVWEFLAKTFTYQGQLVLEPFAGRGSGVISLLRCGLNVIATERDEAHYNALLENVKNLHYLKLNPNFRFK